MQPKELGLMVIFDAIMTEGSITRAAESLSITQPAVSNALARMRSRWNDELFVREGKKLRPTSFAINLALQISEPLKLLHGAISPENFDPATARRSFRICAVTDGVVDDAWCQLRRLIEAEAPGISLYTFPYHIDETEDILMEGKADMIVGHALPPSRLIHTEHLFVPRYVCIMRRDHPLGRGPLALDEFARADHLMVSSMSCETNDVVDQALAGHGLTRRITMTLHHYALAPKIVHNSDLIAVLPSTAIEDAILSGDVLAVEPPVAVSPTPFASLWHERQELDSGLRWLRRHVNGLIPKLAETHFANLKRRLARTPKLAG